MLPIINQLFSPLFSLFLLMVSNGLFTTLVSTHLHHQGYSSLLISTMVTAYYLGLVIGSFRTDSFISRVGHIRAFSAFGSVLASAYLLHGLLGSTTAWLLLRLVSGFATAGLYIVIESWLLVTSEIALRGRVLALYMVVGYSAQAGGQFFIGAADVNNLSLFAFASLLTSLSILPLSITRVPSPVMNAPSTLKLSKLLHCASSGVFGCLVSGLMTAAIFGLFPIYLLAKLHNETVMSYYMALLILGGMALQYPFGRLSDFTDRRTILLISCVLITCFAALIIVAFGHGIESLLIVFFLGGMTYIIYPISIAHACDKLQNEDITAGSQSLLLVYSVGAMIGPIFAALFMQAFGTSGLLCFLIACSTSYSVFLMWRKQQTRQVLSEDSFTAMPQTSPITAEIDPRGD